MLIERSIDVNPVMYVDVIVNRVEYQYEVCKIKEQEQKG